LLPSVFFFKIREFLAALGAKLPVYWAVLPVYWAEALENSEQ
jgi:hypothetical protein